MSHASLARRLMLLAVAVAPAAAVFLVRAVAPHAGPASAVAKGSVAERIEPVRPLTAPQLTGKQPGLAAALRSRTPEYHSPFVVPQSEADREGLLQDPKAKAQASKMPEFTITSIVSGAQTIAFINGKGHRAGDEIDGGWTITEIDATNRQATLKHPEHGTLILKIKTDLE